mgnify:CR=1 FL=1
MKKISMIAAIGNNFELGYQNKLLCHLPRDLKRFKELTMGKTCVMGSRTYKSLIPYFKGEILPGRKKYVLTNDKSKSFYYADSISIEDVLEMAKTEDVFVIGGGQIYDLLTAHADKLYITHIQMNIKADMEHLTYYYQGVDPERFGFELTSEVWVQLHPELNSGDECVFRNYRRKE